MSTIRRRAYAAVQGGELFFHLKKLGRFNQRAVQFYAAQVRAAPPVRGGAGWSLTCTHARRTDDAGARAHPYY
jgi:hypothetical protein